MTTPITERLRDEENFGGMELRLAAAEEIEQLAWLRQRVQVALDSCDMSAEARLVLNEAMAATEP